MNSLNSIGEHIRKHREKAGIKQEEFAELVNLSPTYMGAIERGLKLPRLETFIRIVNALQIPSDVLLSDVLITKNEIYASTIYQQLKQLPDEEQMRIYHVLEVMIDDATK